MGLTPVEDRVYGLLFFFLILPIQHKIVADLSVSSSPSRAKHAERSLPSMKSHFYLSIRVDPTADGMETTQIPHNSSAVIKLVFVATSCQRER